MNWVAFGVNALHWTLLRHAGRAFRKVNLRLTSQQYTVLEMIRQCPGILQDRLRRIRGCVKSTMSRMLTFLEDEGAVERTPSGRNRIVRLTRFGEYVLEVADARLSELPETEDPLYTPYWSEFPGFERLWWAMFAPSLLNWERVEELRDKMGSQFGPFALAHPDD